MAAPITGISSMATRQVLAELAAAYRERSGVAVEIESVGGVDAARRVAAGEAFDVVVLASDAIAKLEAAGAVVAGSAAPLVRSPVAIAVRADARRPDVSTEDALRQAVLDARTIGYSTGPSGTALLALFERWGVAETLRERVVQASPGVPVGTLVARGEVELGFQQYSELMHLAGITVLGPMPPGTEIVTTFAGAVCTASKQADAVRALLDFMRSPAAADAKRRHGMEPA
ncbi:MAG: substrate-binding domain-containing protein [Burkholderiaceae bacterium]|jgi:molybdate transport system substrate-binding protein|nr:substrate-binding domain-containing protein [Burkholderiaceae bacterium]